MTSSIHATIVSPFFLLAVSCGDSDGASPDAMGLDAGLLDAPSSEPEAGASTDATVGTTTVAGEYYGFFQGGTTPVEGADVCVLAGVGPLCDTSDSIGRWRIPGVPAAVDVELRLVADGYMDAYRPIHVPGHLLDLSTFAYASNDLVAYLLSAAETVRAPSTGIVVFEAMRGTIAGVWLRDVVGVSATLRSLRTGGEIYPAGYVNEQQIPLAGLTATTVAGWGYFANVQPGEHELVVTHPTRTCVAHPVLGWPSSEAWSNATAHVPVHPDAVTYATVLCPD